MTEMKETIRRDNPEYLLVIKLADLVDAILFIEHEGIGVHAQEVCRGLKEQFKVRLGQAKQEHPKYDWVIAESLLDELLQNGEGTKVAFEKRERGEQ